MLVSTFFDIPLNFKGLYIVKNVTFSNRIIMLVLDSYFHTLVHTLLKVLGLYQFVNLANLRSSINIYLSQNFKGVSYDGDMNLFIADSESSTIRSVELPYFSVKNVAGGGFDPSDLFSYGDEDGKGEV